MKRFLKIAALILPVVVVGIVLLLFLGGEPDVSAEDLMSGIEARTPESLSTQRFNELVPAAADFAVEVFKNSIESGKNCMVSPVSIYTALAMVGGGASGNTLAEFQDVLADGAEMSDFCAFSRMLSDRLVDYKEGKLDIANSIWYRDSVDLEVKQDFLQKSADYFGAAAYKLDFNKSSSVDKINSWVFENTGRRIKKIINEIDPSALMFLINTVYFDAKWQDQYIEKQVKNGVFHAPSGDVSVPFMHSTESLYLENERATGFIKPYLGGKFGFAAILPNEGTAAEDFAANLTGQELTEILKNAAEGNLSAAIPKFEFEYGISLREALMGMGLQTGFDPQNANFEDMAIYSRGNMYIEEVQHKTYIKVNEIGTIAGAVTEVEMAADGALQPDRRVVLDRPFVYVIFDFETYLPLFIGIMQNPQ